MSEQVKFEKVSGSQGDFEVSTIRTDAGGAAISSSFGAPFTSADYVEDNPWPFETMVFRGTSSRGVYHEPFATKADAIQGHERIATSIREGRLELGAGVRGDFGVPSITPQQWADRLAMK